MFCHNLFREGRGGPIASWLGSVQLKAGHPWSTSVTQIEAGWVLNSIPVETCSFVFFSGEEGSAWNPSPPSSSGSALENDIRSVLCHSLVHIG